MESTSEAPRTARFQVGDLLIDTERHTVVRDGVDLRLPPLSYELLIALVRAHPRMLSTDDLLTKVWAPAIVNPETVGKRVKLLRQALEDEVQNPRYLTAVRGHGFRLVADVTRLGTDAAAAPGSASTVEPATVSNSLTGSALSVMRRWRIAALATGAIATAALIAGIIHEHGLVPAPLATPAATTVEDNAPPLAAVRALAATNPPPPDKSIAVLPFTDLSEKKDEGYFADGVTEEITAMLSQASDLKVSARTSAYYFKDHSVPIRDIGRVLGASHVLEGSVRKSGERVRVTVQLIRTDTGYHIWSANFDRTPSDLFATESDIARTVVDRLSATIRDASALRDHLSTNPAARALFLESVANVYRDTTASRAKAVKDLHRAIEIDPQFALAWTLLSYALDDPREQRKAVDRALQIDPLLADAHVAKSLPLEFVDWDLGAARAELDRALELDPNNQLAMRLKADVLLSCGQYQEAERFAREAVSRAPIDAFNHAELATALWNNNKLPEALDQDRNAVNLVPSSQFLHMLLSSVELANGDPKAAFEEINRPENDPVIRQLFRPVILDALGQHTQAEREQALAERKLGAERGGWLALLYVRRGEKDRAFLWLDRALQAHEFDLIGIQGAPLFASLRSDPRFSALLRKMHVPE